MREYTHIKMEKGLHQQLTAHCDLTGKSMISVVAIALKMYLATDGVAEEMEIAKRRQQIISGKRRTP